MRITPDERAELLSLLTDAGIGDAQLINSTADAIVSGPIAAMISRRFGELNKYIMEAKIACGNQSYSGQLLSEMTAELKAKADKWDRLRANPAICDFLDALLEP